MYEHDNAPQQTGVARTLGQVLGMLLGEPVFVPAYRREFCIAKFSSRTRMLLIPMQEWWHLVSILRALSHGAAFVPSPYFNPKATAALIVSSSQHSLLNAVDQTCFWLRR